MIQQNAKALGVKYKARVQVDLYLDLFQRRLAGEKLILGRGLEQSFLDHPESQTEKKIAKLIHEWREKEQERLQEEIAKQQKRKAGAQAALKKKETQKALEDLRISTQKIDKAQKSLERLGEDVKPRSSDSRIYPLHFASMLCLDEKGERVIRPARYLLRPHDKDESFDRKFFGCYNARFDKLESVPWWRQNFGTRHGLLIVQRFYENVNEDGANRVIEFRPPDDQDLLVPTVWDYWEDRKGVGFYSTALITDEPLPEVALAGHDRTPISLRESAISDWLSPKGKSAAELREILELRVKPKYQHRILESAA